MKPSGRTCSVTEPEFGNEKTGWMTPPVIAALLMVVAMFCRVPLKDVLPNKMFVILLGLLIVTAVVWLDASRMRPLEIGAIEILMGLYLLWNLLSLITPHKYPAFDPLTMPISAPRIVMTGTLIPFVMYAIGRYTFDRAAAVRVLLEAGRHGGADPLPAAYRSTWRNTAIREGVGLTAHNRRTR